MGLWAENQSEAAAFCSVCSNELFKRPTSLLASSLAVLSEERGSPLLSCNAPASANCCRHPAPCFVNCEVSLWRHLIAATLFIISSALNTPRFHGTAHLSSLRWFSHLLRWTQLCSPPACYTPSQHHVTCNGKKSLFLTRSTPGSGLQTLLSHGRLCHVAVCLRFQWGLWTNKSSDVTENSKHVSRTLSHSSMLLQLCGTACTLECCELCTSISASAVLWFSPRTAQGSEFASEMFVVCVLQRGGGRGGCSEEPCCCFITTRRDSLKKTKKKNNVMITLTSTYRAV